MKKAFAMALGTAVAAAMLAAQSSRTAEVQLKAAMQKEEVEGDLKGAIDLYKKIIAANGNNHEIAAKALIQLGQCYEKQGSADARKTYEQVLSKFSDQTEAVAQARARLANLGGGGAAAERATRLVWAGSTAAGNSVSPDGRYLTYINWNTGTLVLHDLATGADRALTDNGDMKGENRAFPQSATISPDGKQVAYTWRVEKTKRYEPWVADLTGDPHPRRLFDGDAAPFDWSPDGKWLGVVFSDERTVEIGLLPAQGGAPRAIKSWPLDSRGIGSATFSPDGKYFAYISRTPYYNTAGRIYILSVDGKAETPLVPEGHAAGSLTWSPDASRIVYTDVAAPRSLWTVRVADGKPAGEPERLNVDCKNCYLTGFTRDGSLYYVRRLWEDDIYLAALDSATGKLTSAPKRVNEHGLGSSWGRIAWLPDGKSLSFWSRRDGGDALVVHALATNEERELWVHASDITGPGYAGWFPDGSVMSWEDNGQMRIFRRLDAVTLKERASWTTPRTVATAQGGASGGFSRDLMTIFITQKDASVPCQDRNRICTYVILARDIQTAKDRELCRFTAVSVGIARTASPDRRDLAIFVRYRDHGSVMIVSIADGSLREVYRHEQGSIATLDWAQDGAHLLAFVNGSAGGELWSFPVQGGPPEKSAFRMELNVGGSSAVSPDGTQIAFVGETRTRPEVRVMPGLFPSAKPVSVR